MINTFSDKHINQIFKIEKTNFENLWDIKKLHAYSTESLASLRYIYSKASRVIDYLMSEIIIDEVHLHNIAVEKNIKIIKQDLN